MFLRVIISVILISAQLISLCPLVLANDLTFLPKPGEMLFLSPVSHPVLLKGLRLDPHNPYNLDFIFDSGTGLKKLVSENQNEFREQALKSIRYFFTTLTMPEQDLWVNLSPYEKDRILPDTLAQTQMGQEMLAQDYVLKQLSASLIYPRTQLGRQFWQRVYEKSKTVLGSTDLPVKTIHKVWVVADQADIKQRKNEAYIVGAHLKVMLDKDYWALSQDGKKVSMAHDNTDRALRELILPEIQKEVEEGSHFVPLRQMFYSMILATWFKQQQAQSLLAKQMLNQHRVGGDLKSEDQDLNQEIYKRYVKAYQQGVFNYVEENLDKKQASLPRKYFSGGIKVAPERVSDSKVNEVSWEGPSYGVHVSWAMSVKKRLEPSKAELREDTKRMIEFMKGFIKDGVIDIDVFKAAALREFGVEITKAQMTHYLNIAEVRSSDLQRTLDKKAKIIEELKQQIFLDKTQGEVFRETVKKDWDKYRLEEQLRISDLLFSLPSEDQDFSSEFKTQSIVNILTFLRNKAWPSLNDQQEMIRLILDHETQFKSHLGETEFAVLKNGIRTRLTRLLEQDIAWSKAISILIKRKLASNFSGKIFDYLNKLRSLTDSQWEEKDLDIIMALLEQNEVSLNDSKVIAKSKVKDFFDALINEETFKKNITNSREMMAYLERIYALLRIPKILDEIEPQWKVRIKNLFLFLLANAQKYLVERMPLLINLISYRAQVWLKDEDLGTEKPNQAMNVFILKPDQVRHANKVNEVWMNSGRRFKLGALIDLNQINEKTLVMTHGAFFVVLRNNRLQVFHETLTGDMQPVASDLFGRFISHQLSSPFVWTAEQSVRGLGVNRGYLLLSVNVKDELNWMIVDLEKLEIELKSGELSSKSKEDKHAAFLNWIQQYKGKKVSLTTEEIQTMFDERTIRETRQELVAHGIKTNANFSRTPIKPDHILKQILKGKSNRGSFIPQKEVGGLSLIASQMKLNIHADEVKSSVNNMPNDDISQPRHMDNQGIHFTIQSIELLNPER